MAYDERNKTMKELTYTRVGDYYIPDIELSEQANEAIGKYGMMRRIYLKEHRTALFNDLVLTEKLFPHLLEVEKAARERLYDMIPKMAEQVGITEELKKNDQKVWCGLMSMIKAQAEEIILEELIYD